MQNINNQRYLQVPKVAKMLDCNKQFIYELIRDGRISAINLGQRQTRVSVESLMAFLKANRVEPGQC